MMRGVEEHYLGTGRGQYGVSIWETVGEDVGQKKWSDG